MQSRYPEKGWGIRSSAMEHLVERPEFQTRGMPTPERREQQRINRETFHLGRGSEARRAARRLVGLMLALVGLGWSLAFVLNGAVRADRGLVLLSAAGVLFFGLIALDLGMRAMKAAK